MTRVAPYQSCIACLKGDVPTGVAIEGEAEWHVACLSKLGVPEDEANGTFLYFAETELGCDKGMVPAGVVTIVYRFCAECARKAEVPEPWAIESGRVPCWEQPDELKLGYGKDLPDGGHRRG